MKVLVMDKTKTSTFIKYYRNIEGRSLENFIFILKYFWKYNKKYIIISNVNTYIRAIKSIYMFVFIPGYIINVATNNYSSDNIIYLLLPYAAFVIYDCIIRSYHLNVTEENLKYNIQAYINKTFFQKFVDIKFEMYENPKFYDEYLWIVTESGKKLNESIHIYIELLGAIISLILNYSIIFALKPIYFLLVIVGVGFSLGFYRILTKLRYELNEKTLNNKKEIYYVNNFFNHVDSSKELRTSNIKKVLYDKHTMSYKEIDRKLRQEIYKRTLISAGLDWLYIIILQSVLYACLSFMILKSHKIMIGDFVTLSSAITNAFIIISAIGNKFSKLKENSIYINKFKKFFAVISTKRNDIEKVEINEFKDIRFTNVNFKYPNSSNYTLVDVNVNINKGDKIAIIGSNGSGKSTFIKLLIGLYEHSSGKIKINSLDIKNCNIINYRSLFGVIFQDFKCISMSIAENILLREIVDKDEDEKIVYNALKKSNLYDKVTNLPNGIYTTLGKEYDSSGAIFSGGEMQRLAIARLYAINCDIIVLDEASSALDITNEYDLYNTIFNDFKDKTIVFISHNIYLTKFADKILVFDNGRIVKNYNQQEFAKQKSKYTALYKNKGIEP